MKLFIWENVEYLTTNYHDSGGLVIMAETLERARELVPAHTDDDGNPRICEAMTQPPDAALTVESEQERVWIFPDAGCC